MWIDRWSASRKEYGLRPVGDDEGELVYVHKDNCRFKKICRGWHGTLDTETGIFQCD